MYCFISNSDPQRFVKLKEIKTSSPQNGNGDKNIGYNVERQEASPQVRKPAGVRYFLMPIRNWNKLGQVIPTEGLTKGETAKVTHL